LLVLAITSTPPTAHVETPPLPRSFWTLLAVTPLAALMANLVNPLFAVFVRDVADVPLERVGVYVGLIALGSAVFSAASGRVADRAGPAPAVIGAGVAVIVARIVRARSETAG